MVQRCRGDRHHYGCFENDIVNMILSLLKITHAGVDTLKSLNEIMPLGEKTLPPRAIVYLLHITTFSVRGIINHFSSRWLGKSNDFQNNVFVLLLLSLVDSQNLKVSPYC